MFPFPIFGELLGLLAPGYGLQRLPIHANVAEEGGEPPGPNPPPPGGTTAHSLPSGATKSRCSAAQRSRGRGLRPGLEAGKRGLNCLPFVLSADARGRVGAGRLQRQNFKRRATPTKLR
jgi:hypothetical protein